MEKTIFLFFFALLFFWKKMEKGNRRRKRIEFRSFFLNFPKEEWGKWWRKNSYIFLFLLFEQRENGKIRFFFRLGFFFEKEGNERGEVRSGIFCFLEKGAGL